MTTHRSRTVSRHGLPTAQIIAAKYAECESLVEARLTMLSHLRIGTVRTKLITEIGNLTYSCCVRPAIASRAIEMYLRNLKSIKPKSEWDRLSENTTQETNSQRRWTAR